MLTGGDKAHNLQHIAQAHAALTRTPAACGGVFMDINGLNNQAIKNYSPRAERTEDAAAKAAKAKDARPDGGGDTLQLSHEAMLHTAARNTAMQTGDMRQDRVDALKAQVADGTYQIDNEKIAMKLLQEEAVIFRNG
jgi:negative regulator of flagellin synthesis FlgM